MSAQEVSKRKLLRAFQKSIEKEKDGFMVGSQNSWKFSYADFLNPKKDTLRLIYSPVTYNLEWCKVGHWTFYEKRKFVISQSQTCKEPPSAKPTNENDFHNLKIVSSSKGLEIEVSGREGLKWKFRVLALVESLKDGIEVTQLTVIKIEK